MSRHRDVSDVVLDVGFVGLTLASDIDVGEISRCYLLISSRVVRA